MRKFASLTYRNVRLLNFIGLNQYRRYQFTPKGAKVSLSILGKTVTVRKGTPDLSVAISCFSGEFDVLKYLLPRDYKGVIVDAGGYIGTSVLALKDLFPEARIIVIEPSEKNIEILKENTAGIENVDVIYGALVGRSVESIMLKNRGTGEWGFTGVENPKDNKKASDMHRTPAFKLSQLGVDVSEIGLLKLDIEGGEYDIFKNDMPTIQTIPIVFAELHDRIVEGCSELFFKFAKNRILVKDNGEKFLAIKRD